MKATTLFFLAMTAVAQAQTGFAIHDGDRVVFYGDSITDNGPYTSFIESAIVTRFPGMKVRFYNAGVGGDRTTGSWMGPVDDRLTRDLFSRQPTVVTVMLGMNDASYRPFEQGIFDTYAGGYRHMTDRFSREIPKAKVWLLRPSPYDDVTRAPGWTEGYNSVLLRYSDFVSDLAKQKGYGVADLNSPVVAMLTAAKASDPKAAATIIGDRVHPGWQGHSVMAEQVLKAWGFPAVVSAVTLDASNLKAQSVNAKTSDTQKVGTDVSWKSMENALPLSINRNDPLMALVLKSSDLDTALNQETLTVKNLNPGTYTLKIDGTAVATLPSAQWAAGVNLATLNTPMTKQADEVANLTNKRVSLRYSYWRSVEFPLWKDGLAAKSGVDAAVDKLDRELVARQHEAAKPKTHRFELVRSGD